MSTNFYPVLLDLRDRLCVVLGGGSVAAEKVRGLLEAGARVRSIAATPSHELRQLAAERGLDLVERDYRPGDLDGAQLVIAERSSPERHAALLAEAEARRVFLNVQDEPAHCSFIAPAIVRRGDLTVAISTGGAAPALAVRLRQRLERELGSEHGSLLALARRYRRPLAASGAAFEERRRRWYELVDSQVLELLRRGDPGAAQGLATAILGVEPEPAGGTA